MTEFKKGSETPPSGAITRSRTSVEIAEQLERDAASLVLTGVSFAKDKAFYDAVAANLREAVDRLYEFGRLQDNLPAIRREHGLNGRFSGMTAARRIADCFGAVMPPDFAGDARIWRAACQAVGDAISALRDSKHDPKDMAPQGQVHP